jgi:hypothetical protein
VLELLLEPLVHQTLHQLLLVQPLPLVLSQ